MTTMEKCWAIIEKETHPAFIAMTLCGQCGMVIPAVAMKAPVPSPLLCIHCRSFSAPVIGVSHTAN